MSGPATSPLKIAIVEAEPAARLGLSHYLESASIRVVLEIDKVARADLLFGNPIPDAALIDIDLDGGAGLELIRRAQRKPLPIRCVAWLRRNNAQDVLMALRAGATGVVSRRDPLNEILLALLSAVIGYNYLSDTAAAALGEGIRNHGFFTPTHPSLPERQSQVFRLLGEGLTSGQVARRMGISLKTVYTHIDRLKVRLNCRNQLALHRIATLAVAPPLSSNRTKRDRMRCASSGKPLKAPFPG